MRSGEQEEIWQFIPCSRYKNSQEKPSLSKKTAYSLRHKRDYHGSEGVWSSAAHKALGTTAKVSLHTLNSKNAEEPPTQQDTGSAGPLGP